jgi:hypothetical protein
MATTQVRGTTQIMDGTIADVKIAAAAAIQTSKLAQGANFIQRDGSVVFTAAQAHGTSDTVSASNQLITKVADPVNNQDAATKAWVLSQVVGGVVSSQSAKAATTANITLSATQSVDGAALSAGDVCLVKNQSTPGTNGLYVVSAGAWTRHTSMDTWAEVPGMIVSVQMGTANADTLWLSTADPGGTLGTTAVTFIQMPGPSDIQAGNALTRTGQVIDVVPKNTSLIVTANDIEVNQGTILAKADMIVRDGDGTGGKATWTANGSTTVFTMAFTPSGDNLMLFLNGILQEPGAGNDYTLSSATITMLTAPATGDRLRATYLKGAATTAIV